MNIDHFDFYLPEQLIAQTPLANREASRMLMLERTTGAISHRMFTDMLDYLRPGDLLVMNDTKVLPARLIGIKHATGTAIELLLLRSISGDQ
jgi:S-adenosylmethionine:tRNA ribosyltransferase-isomerase